MIARLPQRPRAFRLIVAKTDLRPKQWTPASYGTASCPCSPIKVFPWRRLVGHSSTAVTELVYRKQIRPVMQEATAMDRIFKT
ncbi:hypothetical protein [Nonomuraea sp. NPDC003754]